MRKLKAAFFNNIQHTQKILDKVYACGRKEMIADLTELYPEVITSENFEQHVDNLHSLEVIFSTWGMPVLTKEQIDKLHSLKVLFYGAGTIKEFAEPFLQKGIKVVSAWKANAISVAEFCLGQVLLSAKGYYLNLRGYKTPVFADKAYDTAYRGPGVYNIKCALIGAGAISLRLQELLKPFKIEIVVVPSRTKQRVVSLEEAFKSCYIVSNHLPSRADNHGVLCRDLFQSMPFGATFINTGRGAQVKENELIEVLEKRPDLTVLLDVTEPEPVSPDSGLLKLPNVYLTTHIAGSINNELVRMADYVINDFHRWQKGKPMLNEVSLESFFEMA